MLYLSHPRHPNVSTPTGTCDRQLTDFATHSVDYWFIRRGNIHMPSVFIGDQSSIYWYWRGFNWRAYAAWVVGAALVVHGVGNALNPGTLGIASTRMYNMGFLISTCAGGFSYYVFCRIWPVKVYPDAHADEPVKWEHMASTEGYFEDDNLIPDYLTDRDVFPGMITRSYSAADEKDMERDGMNKDGQVVTRIIAV
jgi:NCS1 family nucleobase:cation symporter-1